MREENLGAVAILICSGIALMIVLPVAIAIALLGGRK
jgi:hypothetical protein